jgi:beta-ribofuranosylaminobenzene 5'-phosphate synthase
MVVHHTHACAETRDKTRGRGGAFWIKLKRSGTNHPVPMAATDLFRQFEAELPDLSPIQKVLLLTDGSVTTLLEAVFGEQIEVRTIAQEVVPADRITAERLECVIGDPINHRVVVLAGSRTGRVFAHAVSCTPLDRLVPGARDDLLAADIPIGRILQRHRMETRRELSEIEAVRAGRSLGRCFGLSEDAVLLSRRYVIIHEGRPLIWIQERFPYDGGTSDRTTLEAVNAGAGGQKPERLVIEAPSRLHLGLIDLNGALGRVDGGIGITLANPCSVMEAVASDTITVSGVTQGHRERIAEAARRMIDHLGLRGGVALRVRESPPQHVGLGSGTQLALAAGTAVARLARRELAVREIANVVGRGGTSGIGTAAFASGGFILDGGHSFGPDREKQEFRPSAASRGVPPPPVLTRLSFPDEWRIVLALPRTRPDVGGTREMDLFREHCPVPLDEVRSMCHEVVMRMLPGVAGRDLPLFANAVNAVQSLGFKRVELGLQAPEVSSLIATMREAGAACAGLSSFGPTVFAITDDDPAKVARVAEEQIGDRGGMVVVTGGRNYGAVY